MAQKIREVINKNMAAFMTILAFASLLLLWELVSRLTSARMFLPPASQIVGKFFQSFVTPIGKHTMPAHIAVSLYRVLVAFSLAALAGIALGVWVFQAGGSHRKANL